MGDAAVRADSSVLDASVPHDLGAALDASAGAAHAAADAAGHGADAAAHAGQAGGTVTVVVGILAVGFCYLLADTVVERIQRRFLVLAGVQFLLLGYLLGPEFPWVPALNNLSSIFPVIALAAGWVGLLRGTQFEAEELRASTGATWSIVLLHHALAGLLTGGVSYWFFMSGLVGEVGARSAGVCA